jgi:two-component system cell cycle response regulator
MARLTRLHVLQRDSQPLEVATARLRTWGYGVADAGSAADAFQSVARGGADVLMIDAWVDDGMTLLAELKADPALRRLPVIVVTTEEPSAVASHALALGADDLLTLPIEDAELYARIRAVSRLAVMEAERERRATVLAQFGLRSSAETPSVPALDRLAILLIGPAGANQVQVMTALSGAATAAYAETAESALERLRRDDIDLALITAGHDEFPLRDLAAAIRSDPELFDLPLLVVGRRDRFGDRADLFDWGLSDVLLQPFEPEVLRLRVQGWVRQQRLRRTLRLGLHGSDPSPAIDRLTRLFGHGFLHAYVDHVIADGARDGAALAVAGFAVAGMTRINQAVGYPVGDRMLAELGAGILRSSRAEDLAARYGGDRFCVVLDGADAEEARVVGERIAEIVGRTPVRVPDGRELLVSLSMGIAALEPGDDAVSLIGRAFADAEAVALRQAS